MSDVKRNWCFTIFDVSKEPLLHDSIRYLVYQLEACPTTGRQHWQGYVEFEGKGGIRFTGCLKRLGYKKGDGRVAISRGDHTANFNYCTKDDSRVAGTIPFVYGQGIGQGSRTDIKKVHEMVLDGKDNKEIALAHPEDYMRMHRGVDALRRALLPTRSDDGKGEMPEGYIICGPAGAGKSRCVRDNIALGRKVYEKDNSKWWDGYNGEPIVVINEFKLGPDMTREQLCRLCDRYPARVEDKGGSMPFAAKVIVLTFNGTPEEVFGAMHWASLARRFKVFRDGDLPPHPLDELYE